MGRVFDSLEEVDITGERLSAPLPLGPDGLIRTGVLENGLTYYVRSGVSRPRGRAALSLAVRAGSLCETEEERGVAHIVEHLAFNATERFSNHELVRFLESIGAEMGACQNAFTSPDETVFHLLVPHQPTTQGSADPVSPDGSLVVIDQAIGILAEWAYRIRCLPEDLTRERGPVLEELRAADNATGRLQQAHWRLIFQDSLYADRIPIGSEPVITGCTAETVRRWYKQWYRPELMAVVAVGDFEDPDAIVELIRRHMLDTKSSSGFSSPSGGRRRRSSHVHGDGHHHHHRHHHRRQSQNQSQGNLTAEADTSPPAGAAEPPAVDTCTAPSLSGIVPSQSLASGFYATGSAGGSSSSLTTEGVSPPPPTARLAPPEVPFVPHEEPRMKVLFDPESTSPGGALYVSFKSMRRPVCSAAEYLDLMAQTAFESALNSRLFKLTRKKPRPPFAAANISHEDICRSTSASVIAIEPWVEGGAAGGSGSSVALNDSDFESTPLLGALASVLRELARVRLYGFSEREIERATKEMKSDAESAWLESEQVSCDEARDELLQHFLGGEFATGPDFEARLSKSLLQGVTAAAVAARAATLTSSDSCVVKAVAHREGLVDEQGIRKVLARVAAEEAAGDVPRWVEDAEAPDAIMQERPAPGEIVEEKYLKALDVYEIHLKNGLRVCVRPARRQRDELRVAGTAIGGLSEVPPSLFPSARLSKLLAWELGMFGLPPDALAEAMAGSRVELDVSEGAYSRSFRGVCGAGELEVVLQLLHKLFTTKVRRGAAEDLEGPLRFCRENIEAQRRSPAALFQAQARRLNYQGCYYFEPLTAEDLEAADVDIALAHHNMNFHNPAEFTIVIAGDLDKAEVEQLVQIYLASIPATPLLPPRAPSDVTPLPADFPAESRVEEIQVPMVGSSCQLLVSLPLLMVRETAREDLMWAMLLARLVESRLLQRLRFAEGRIYGVSVTPFSGCEAPSNTGPPRAELSVSLSCAPAARRQILEAALDEIARLQSSPPSPEEVETVRTLERVKFESAQTENSYWVEVLLRAYGSRAFQDCQDVDKIYLESVEARQKLLEQLSPATLQAAFARLLPNPPRDRYTALMMVPQKPTLLKRISQFLLGASATPVPAAETAEILAPEKAESVPARPVRSASAFRKDAWFAAGRAAVGHNQSDDAGHDAGTVASNSRSYQLYGGSLYAASATLVVAVAAVTAGLYYLKFTRAARR